MKAQLLNPEHKPGKPKQTKADNKQRTVDPYEAQQNLIKSQSEAAKPRNILKNQAAGTQDCKEQEPAQQLLSRCALMKRFRVQANQRRILRSSGLGSSRVLGFRLCDSGLPGVEFKLYRV